MAELVLAQDLEISARSHFLDEEAEWVEGARARDLEAFDLIMMRYEQRLLRFLIGLVNGDVGVAQELCQDTFLAAYRSLPKTKDPLKLSAWLHKIELNNARSHHRQRRRRFTVPLDDHEIADGQQDIVQALAENDVVLRTLARIPKQYCEPLLLQTVSGMTCREIATVMRSSEGAIKIRLMRARRAFKIAYAKETTG